MKLYGNALSLFLADANVGKFHFKFGIAEYFA